MNKELLFLRTFAIAIAIGVVVLLLTAFRQNGNQKFSQIDVERINIVEKDGTVKLIITNRESFPTEEEVINGRPGGHEFRGKSAGMLFFNDDGIETGGFVFHGEKTEEGHGTGLSFTFDQYDGDQVMQIITQDYQQGDQRIVHSKLLFNDQPKNVTQLELIRIVRELRQLQEENPQEAAKRWQEIQNQQLGGTLRIELGKILDQNYNSNDGLFLYDSKGNPRAMFFIDSENNPKLVFLDENNNIIASYPEEKGSK